MEVLWFVGYAVIAAITAGAFSNPKQWLAWDDFVVDMGVACFLGVLWIFTIPFVVGVAIQGMIIGEREDK